MQILDVKIQLQIVFFTKYGKFKHKSDFLCGRFQFYTDIVGSQLNILGCFKIVKLGDVPKLKKSKYICQQDKYLI